MVGIPVFVDQGDVLTRIVDKEIGVGLDKAATADEIYNAVVEVRDNKIYRENIRRLSTLMKLRQHSPMEDTVWLVEYVARSGGAEHLKLASRHLNLVQYYSLDSMALILSCMVLILYIGSAFCTSFTVQKLKIS